MTTRKIAISATFVVCLIRNLRLTEAGLVILAQPSHLGAIKITHDNKTFTITGQQWAGTYPLNDLDKWLTFYRKQRNDFPKAGASYDATIAELEVLAHDLRISA